MIQTLQLILTFIKEWAKKGFTTVLNCEVLVSYIMFSTNFWTRKLYRFAVLSFTSHKNILKICIQKMGLYINSFLKSLLILDLDSLKALVTFHSYSTVHWTVWTCYPSILYKQTINIYLQALFWGVMVSTESHG